MNIRERVKELRNRLDYKCPCDCWDGYRPDCQCGKPEDAAEVRAWANDAKTAARIDAILADWPEGEVVVTTDDHGQAVAVTRQDSEGKILSVIWKQPSLPSEDTSENPEPTGDWRPIKTAPKERKVLVWRPDEGDGIHHGHHAVDHYSVGARAWWKSRRDQQPTHWMPLPTPPS